MVRVGQKVRFDPYHAIRSPGVAPVGGEAIGTVVLVHPSHRYFTAEYEVGTEKFRISFKFDDFDRPYQNVHIVEE